MTLVVNKYITVREDAISDVDTGITLKNGDFLDISASGTIWAGVWFTGRNGPDGWAGWYAKPTSPLPGYAPFSLLGKTAEDGYFPIGHNLRRQFLNEQVGEMGTRLYLRINDDTPANGDGGFQCHIQVWR
ncbi:hypothetical protein BAC3_01782 [uncultured bacterium]|nr:hypothetical protein BAC3_01782 [uncultured bacterium]